MSSVWVVITIPESEYENEVREKEKLSTRLSVKKKRESLKTISEIETNISNDSIEKIVEDGLSFLGIVDAIWQKSKNEKYHTITFQIDMQDSDSVIQYLKSLGVGRRLDTSIGIIPFSLFCYNEELNEIVDKEIIIENGENDVSKSLGNFNEKQSQFLKSVTARLTVAQVVNNVRSDATLTFDYVCNVIFGSWIAAMGLMENSVPCLVASMLVSPMMGPLMALNFGTVIKEGSLIRLGIRNSIISSALTVGFGFFFGLIAFNFTEHWNSDIPWPNISMQERGVLRVIWVGTLIAFPSGCAVAVSLLSGNQASLVGVAISVSLLPPNVNSGLLLGYSAIRGFYSIGQTPIEYHSQLTNSTIWLKQALIPYDGYKVIYSDNMAVESFLLGLISFIFYLVNVTNIYLGGILLLKIKEIAPLSTLSKENRRFFQEDIKIAREYNAKQSSQSTDDLGKAVLTEWADIAGLDKNEILKPEARAVQLQTLADIAKDVEEDVVFKSITKNMSTIGDNMARRLSNCAIGNGHFRGSFRKAATPSPTFKIAVTGPENENNPSPSPLIYGNGRRRVSTLVVHNMFDKSDNGSNSGGRSPKSAGIVNTAFSFNEIDISNHQKQLTHERNRRFNSALLRRTLHATEHAPFSLWPSTRPPISEEGKFTVTPVTEYSATRASNSHLNKCD